MESRLSTPAAKPIYTSALNGMAISMFRRDGLLHRSVAGGGQYVYSGGLAYEAFIEGGGGFRDVYFGGTAEYDYVYSGGYQEVYGSAYGAYVLAGGVENVEMRRSRFVQLCLRLGKYLCGRSRLVDLLSAAAAPNMCTATPTTPLLRCSANQYIESGGYAYGTNDGWNQFV